MPKTTLPTIPRKYGGDDSRLPSRFHAVFGSIVTLLEYIKKAYIQRQYSQGVINHFKCFVLKNKRGWGSSWKHGIVPTAIVMPKLEHMEVMAPISDQSMTPSHLRAGER